MPALSNHPTQTEFSQWLSVAGNKGPRDDDDTIGQRWFAKRIAEMKWWGDNGKALEIEAPLAEEDRQPQTGEAEQPAQDDDGSAERG